MIYMHDHSNANKLHRMMQVDDRKAGLEKKAKDAARREADEKDRVAREAGKKRPLAEVLCFK